MAESQPDPQTETEPAPESGVVAKLTALPVAFLQWGGQTRTRAIVLGVGTLTALVVVFGTWSYVAHLAIDHDDSITLKAAYRALDEGRVTEARDIVGKLKSETAESLSFGGALFILGVAKARQADEEYSVDRGRAMHLVASRYLQKAMVLGLPKSREPTARYELGRSLILGNQSQAGIEMLEGLKEVPEKKAAEMHALLVKACLYTSSPQLEKALQHINYALEEGHADPGVREHARQEQAKILLRLNQLDEAEESIRLLDVQPENRAIRNLLLGRLSVARAMQRSKDDPQRRTQLEGAISQLRLAERYDTQSGPITRRAMFEIAIALQESGQQEAAVMQFDRIGKLYGETPVGIASTLAEADLERRSGKFSEALDGYRTALEAINNPVTYVNPLLPLEELRKRLLAAYQQFVDDSHFDEALKLLDQFDPVFSHIELVELRAKTEEKWAEWLLEEAERDDRWHAKLTRKKARTRYRTAGRAYEDLAQMRYATRYFTDDLWAAGECYYRGQSYSQTVETLKRYLHQEVRRRNSLALLRVGQSHLALRKPEQAIEALKECIELYPRDAVIYQARLECSQAFRQLGKSKEAEEMLRANLTGDELTPTSPEWLDSLFAFGTLLHETHRYDSAISKLEEAVQRSQRQEGVRAGRREEQELIALYTIARAHHHAAEIPQQRIRTAKTEAERQQNRKELLESLEKAHQAYVDVQRMITLEGYGESDPLHRTLLRNCYMMQGSVLFDLRKFEQARQAYSNVSTLYQNEPFVLESFVKIANCFRRLDEPLKARGTLMQAKQVLERLPPDADFRLTTNFTRQQWGLVLDQMSQW